MLFQLLVVCIFKNLHKEQNIFYRWSDAHLLSPILSKKGDFQMVAKAQFNLAI